jgi:hypothetical protein
MTGVAALESSGIVSGHPSIARPDLSGPAWLSSTHVELVARSCVHAKHPAFDIAGLVVRPHNAMEKLLQSSLAANA